MIRAGDLTSRIRIEKRTGATDSIGQPLDSWETVAELWADIKGHSGMGTITRLQEQVPASVERYSIRIRYREDITAGMRVVHGSRRFAIRQVRMDFARRVYTDLVCEVGGHAG